MRFTHKLTLLALAVCAQSAWAQQHFALQSPSVHAGKSLSNAQVFKGFGCEGDNTSPALQWKNPPKGTKSFAITMYDPDAPTGSGWWHWAAYNLPAETRQLEEGAGDAQSPHLPSGAVQLKTDFGTLGYGGACPPKGSKPHRYIFKVHALNVPTLDLPAEASPALLGFMINSHSMGSATLTATYRR